MKPLKEAIRERKEFAECNYDDPEDFSDEDAIEELEADCGMTRDGGCTMAGSEYCDWECPFSGGPPDYDNQPIERIDD